MPISQITPVTKLSLPVLILLVLGTTPLLWENGLTIFATCNGVRGLNSSGSQKKRIDSYRHPLQERVEAVTEVPGLAVNGCYHGSCWSAALTVAIGCRSRTGSKRGDINGVVDRTGCGGKGFWLPATNSPTLGVRCGKGERITRTISVRGTGNAGLCGQRDSRRRLLCEWNRDEHGIAAYRDWLKGLSRPAEASAHSAGAST